MSETRVCNVCGVEKPLTREFYGHNGYKNKDGVNAFRRTCRECIKARNRAKRLANLGEWRARELVRSQRYQAKKDRFIPSTELISGLWHEQEGRCYLCTAPLDRNKINVDHKTPVSQGGSNDEENLGLTCATCNKEKHGKSVEQYRQWQRESA